MGKFLNPRDVFIIAAITVIVHVLAKPLYRSIDNATVAE